MLSRTRRQRLGDAAEARVDAAAKKRGWRLITANYQVRGGELDRVYQGPDSVIVVEVRYRSRADYGTAAASVTHHKQRRVVLATRHLLAERPRLARQPIRFDVVGVDANDEIDWIENAFYAE
ncbi:YraN family protein [Salinisphaera japonica]|uniref:UPF0102 protein SAJA_06495 n=1 Tax=Salinisphaera japonica YTM-1 TaxID=1209778 RepID=A0A423PUY8_9GAMM|nr:YraN family protein [Salinisphaera japonica]ROO29408.1 hypothetical protein SAJA_06495 [Salinisphaera japonica YTM-1]